MQVSILKFGGTSVGSASAMVDVARRVTEDESNTKIVVLSALSKITDSLLNIANLSYKDREGTNSIISEIEKRHINLVRELIPDNNQITIEGIKNLIFELKKLCEGIYYIEEITNKLTDKILSYGEKLSTFVFYNYIKSLGFEAKLFNSEEFIKTDSNFNQARPLYNETYEKFKHFEISNGIKIFQGFIGSDFEGNITTLGRGGSDFTASIIGAALKNNGFNVKNIQIYTDVDGILNCDPRINNSYKLIPEISYKEVLELSFFGAKVLHPDTIKPAIENQIPVYVKNTFNPSISGTKITNDSINIEKIEIELNSLIYVKINPKNSFFSSDELIKIFNLIQQLNEQIYYQSYFLNNFVIIFKNKPEIIDNLSSNFNISAFECKAKAYVSSNPDLEISRNNKLITGYSDYSYIEIYELRKIDLSN